MTEITVKNAVNALNVQNTAPNVKSVMSVPITKERIARNVKTVCSLQGTTAVNASNAITAFQIGAVNVRNVWTVPPAVTVRTAVPATATQTFVNYVYAASRTAVVVPATRVARPAWCAIWKMRLPARTAAPALSPAMARHTVRNVTPVQTVWETNSVKNVSYVTTVQETTNVIVPTAANV